MEDVVKMVNTGAIRHEKSKPREYFEANDVNEINTSSDTDELMLISSIETGASAEKLRAPTAVISVDADADKPDKPIEHVRSPELRRHGTKLLMTAAAAVGAAAGARIVFGEETLEALMNSVSQTLAGTFGEIFLRQMILGIMFLAAEFILGFFALGDLAVWIAPFLCGAGTVLRLAASSPKLLPGAVVCLGGVIMGAAYSADMSGLLLKLTKGGTVYMDAHPRRSYAVGFIGCLAAVILGSILTGILANV